MSRALVRAVPGRRDTLLPGVEAACRERVADRLGRALNARLSTLELTKTTRMNS